MTNYKTVRVTAQWLLIAFFAMVVFVPTFRTPTVRVITIALVLLHGALTTWIAWRRGLLTMTPGQIYRSGLKAAPIELVSGCMALAAIVLVSV
jgi:hypothetical protein